MTLRCDSGLPVDRSQTGCRNETATDRWPCGAGGRNGTHDSLFLVPAFFELTKKGAEHDARRRREC